MKRAYRKYYVYHVHQTENQVANLGLVVAITCEDQSAGYNVMGKHLEIVFPPLFDVHHKDLLQPERKLDQIVPFE